MTCRPTRRAALRLLGACGLSAAFSGSGGALRSAPLPDHRQSSPAPGPFARPPISRANFALRLERVRERMRKGGLDCLLVSSVLNHAVRYLGFFDTELQGRGSGAPQLISVLLPAEQDPVLFVQTFTAADYMLPRAKAASYVNDIRLVGGGNQQVLKAVSDQLRAWKLERGTLGMAGGEIEWAERLFFQSRMPGLRLTDSNPLLDSLRIVKEPEEIELLRRSAEIAVRAMREVERSIHAGITDYELYAVGEAAMIRGGGDEDSFVLMGVGPSANPMIMDPLCGQQVQPGDVIVYETLPFFRLYNTELAVTFGVGKPSAKQTRAAEAAEAAYWAGTAAGKPGGSSFSMVQAALKAFREHGFQSFTHAPGHFIGLDNYEGPPLRSPAVVLQPGMVLSFHPNVVISGHVKEEICGILLVTEKGLENLFHYPPRGMRIVQ